MTSAQDGGLGGARPALAERALARRSGLVREAGDAAPPGLGPGEREGGALRVRRPFLEFRAHRPAGFWDAAPQGAEWNAARVSASPASRGDQHLLPRGGVGSGLQDILWTPLPLATTWVPGRRVTCSSAPWRIT